MTDTSPHLKLPLSMLCSGELKTETDRTLFKKKKCSVNSLPNSKILDWSKLNAFADTKTNMIETMKFFLEKIENNVGNGEKCWLPTFSPFPKMFSKGLFLTLYQTTNF